MNDKQQSTGFLLAAALLVGIGIALVVTFCVLFYWPTTFLFMGLVFIVIGWLLDVPRRRPPRR
jgi:hypothetical protein